MQLSPRLPGSSICCIGLGTFGLPIALHCMYVGFEVIAPDGSRDLAGKKALVEAGGRVVPPATLECDAMVMCLPNAEVVRDIVERHRHHLPPVIVDLSSHSPRAARALHEYCTQFGSTYIDAPVSGSVEDAARGTLTVFIGAARGAGGLADAITDAIADKRFHFGEVGRGQGVKLVNQLVHISNVAVLGEGLRLARHLGLPAADALEALASASADSAMLRRFGPGLAEPDAFQVAFKTALAAKDMGNVRSEYADAGGTLPIQSIVLEALQAAASAGLAGENFTRLIDFLPGAPEPATGP